MMFSDMPPKKEMTPIVIDHLMVEAMQSCYNECTPFNAIHSYTPPEQYTMPSSNTNLQSQWASMPILHSIMEKKQKEVQKWIHERRCARSETKPLLLIHGPQGSGKSTLIRAAKTCFSRVKIWEIDRIDVVDDNECVILQSIASIYDRLRSSSDHQWTWIVLHRLDDFPKKWIEEFAERILYVRFSSAKTLLFATAHDLTLLNKAIVKMELVESIHCHAWKLPQVRELLRFWFVNQKEEKKKEDPKSKKKLIENQISSITRQLNVPYNLHEVEILYIQCSQLSTSIISGSSDYANQKTPFDIVSDLTRQMGPTFKDGLVTMPHLTVDEFSLKLHRCSSIEMVYNLFHQNYIRFYTKLPKDEDKRQTKKDTQKDMEHIAEAMESWSSCDVLLGRRNQFDYESRYESIHHDRSTNNYYSATTLFSALSFLLPWQLYHQSRAMRSSKAPGEWFKLQMPMLKSVDFTIQHNGEAFMTFFETYVFGLYKDPIWCVLISQFGEDVGTAIWERIGVTSSDSRKNFEPICIPFTRPEELLLFASGPAANSIHQYERRKKKKSKIGGKRKTQIIDIQHPFNIATRLFAKEHIDMAYLFARWPQFQKLKY